MKRMLLAVLAVSISFPVRSAYPRGLEAIRQEAGRRHEELVRDGFNLTRGYGLDTGEGNAPMAR